jgi:transposase-like protein
MEPEPRMTFRLSRSERLVLERMLLTVRDRRALSRIRALLELDAGCSPGLVARAHQVSRSTVYNWIRRAKAGDLTEAAMRDRPRSGRPRHRPLPVRDGAGEPCLERVISPVPAATVAKPRSRA